jgi:hypothetical protein
LYCGAGLVGYDARIYGEKPLIATLIQNHFHNMANSQVEKIEYYLNKHGLSQCEVHLFLIPQASVDKLRQLFVDAVKG